MNKSYNISITLTLLAVLAFLIIPHQAHADFLSIGSITVGAISNVMAWIGNLVLILVSRFVWISGIFLDMSVNISINMSSFLAQLPLIDTGWKIFRDLANMIFIFVLLYIAIKTIIGLGSSETKSLLTRIIIVALLINFSLFITRIIVDASNVVALQFYNSMAPSNTTNTFPPKDSAFYDGGLAAQFVNALSLTTVYKTGRSGTDAGNTNSVADTGASVFGSSGLAPDKIIVISVFGSIFMLIAAFIFFVAGILFLIRMVVLALLMILSPVAFVASIMPKTEEYSSKWWSQLFNQSLFAPLYLALTYVVIQTINSQAFRSALGFGKSFTDTLVGTDANSVTVAVNFVIIIIFMLASLIVAKQMGAIGTDFAQKWAGKASFGLASNIGRRTLGALGRGMSRVNFNAGTVASNLVNRNFRAAARGAVSLGPVGGGKSIFAKYGNKMATGDYDFRGTTAGKALGGLIGKEGFGEFKSAKDRAREDRKEAEEKAKDAQAKKLADLTAQLKTSDALTSRTIIGSMTDSEVKGLDGSILTRPEIIQHLNHAHLDAIQKSGHLTTAEKATIKAEILRRGAPAGGAPIPGTGFGYMNGGGGNLW